MDREFHLKGQTNKAVVKFNYDEDTYEIVEHGATPDMISVIEYNQYSDLENHPEREVSKVERILGERQFARDENAEKFL